MNPTLSKESGQSDESEQNRIISRFWIVTLLTASVIVAIAIVFLLLQS